MAKASFDAMKDSKPEERPWIYSRSGYCGIQKYSRSWTGDNVSDWTTLKYNQYMGIGLGLSAMPYFVHDLGGFFGKIPSEELLIRSCQSAVFQPRFVIHSWRKNGKPTEPWTYKTALEPIRSLIREHYRFMPYLYSTAVQAALEGTLMDRSLHLEFPHDAMLADDLTYSMLGDSVLKASVVDQQTTSILIRFPQGVMWYEGETGLLIAGGTEREFESKPDGTHLWFAKAGSAIATSVSADKLVGPFKHVVFLIFPSMGGIMENRFYEDNGKTDLKLERYNRWNITVSDTEAMFTLHKKGFSPQGRLFSVHGHTFDPDALREQESVTIPIR
jgi:alpha-glucosidase